MKKFVIWTKAYNPWVMGGNPHQPIGCEVEVSRAKAIGKGFYAYEIKSPGGKTIVAEKTTGAIVGNSMQQVIEDVAGGKKREMQKQVNEAAKQREQVRVVSAKEFWERYESAKEFWER